MGERVGWGVLGCAGIARRSFLPALAQAEGKLVALASRDAAKAQAWATEFGAERSYGSYEELLADPAVEAVYVPLPNSEHAPWTIRAAGAGKHVFCEKPLATSAEEAQSMVDACKRAGVYLFEAFVYHCHPQTLDLKRRLLAGAIGEVRGAFVKFNFHLGNRQGNIRMRADLAGGALMDVGCYSLSYCRFAFGAEPLAISAEAVFDALSGVDISMTSSLLFSSGVASAMGSMDMQGGQEALIYGTKGCMRIATPFHPGRQAGVIVARHGRTEELQYGSELLPFHPAIKHFEDVVRQRVAPLVEPQESVANMRAVQAAAASMREQRRVEL
jgi:xylose dehydrogenase (NAD/NADP)